MEKFGGRGRGRHREGALPPSYANAFEQIFSTPCYLCRCAADLQAAASALKIACSLDWSIKLQWSQQIPLVYSGSHHI